MTKGEIFELDNILLFIGLFYINYNNITTYDCYINEIEKLLIRHKLIVPKINLINVFR